MYKYFLRVSLPFFLLLTLGFAPAYAQSIQASGINFGSGNVLSESSGNGAPSGSCSGLARYTQLDATAGANLWLCISGTYVHQAGGSSAFTSGALQYATSTSATRAATYADIIALFSGCTGTQYPGADGACHASGSSSAALSNAIVGTGSGSTDAGSPPLLVKAPASANAIPSQGSTSTGIPSNTLAIELLGNSTVALQEPAWIPGVCSATANGGPWAGSSCRQATAINCDSSSNCVVQIDNHDGFFQVGNWYSGGGGTLTCLVDGPYQLSAVTATSVSLNGVTSNETCPSVTGTTNNFLTDVVNRFGTSGGLFAAIYSGTGNWTYGNLKTVAAAQAAQGKIPVLATLTNHINDTRQFLTTGTYPSVISDMTTLINDWNANRPGSPVVLIEEEGPLQGHGAGTQYVCPEGTAHNTGCTSNNTSAPTSTSGAISAATSATATSLYITSNVVTVNATNSFTAGEYITFPAGTWTTATYFNGRTFQLTGATTSTYTFNASQSNLGSVGSPTADTGVANGTNTATLSYCPTSLWGGAGLLPTVLAPDGVTPYQVILDTTGSGVQETVNLVNLTVSGSSCSISFANVNAHSAGYQSQTTEATAAIEMGVIIHNAYLALLSKYRNVIGLPVQGVLVPLTAQPYTGSSTNGCYIDQLHIANCADLEGRILAKITAQLANTPAQQTQQASGWLDALIPNVSNGFVNSYRMLYPLSVDPAFSEQTATVNRFSNVNGSTGLINNLETGTPAYPLEPEDPYFYKTILTGSVQPAASTNTLIYVGLPTNSTLSELSTFIPGFDKLCLVGVSCFVPTTLTATASGNFTVYLTVNTNPWLTLLKQNPANHGFQIAIQRPVMADEQWSLSYYVNPKYHQIGLGTVTANTTGTPSTFTLSLQSIASQHADSLTLFPGDIIVVRNVGATKLAATVTCGPTGGHVSTVTCSDSAGTSYATWTTGSYMDIYTTRNLDVEGSNVIAGVQVASANQTQSSDWLATYSTTYDGSGQVDNVIGWQAIPASTSNNPINNLTFGAATTTGGVNQASTGGIGLDLHNAKQILTTGIGGYGTATYAAGSAAGTSPGTPACVASHVCDSLSGTIDFTVGTSTGVGVLLTVTTGVTRTNQANCDGTIYLLASPYTQIPMRMTETTTTYVFNVGTAPTASTAYELVYQCTGN